jgi:hypothetical protein
MVIINIDTSKDSKEEIRETIKYLQGIVGENAVTNAPEFLNPLAPEDSSSGGVLGMFDNPLQPSEETTVSTAENPDEEKLDAESLLKESDEYVEVQASDDGDDDVEVVDEQADTFIEIVEYN